jgi:SAM-dependent methyltransferase
MPQQDRLEICGQRYRQRRDDGLAGWACDESYDRKITNALAIIAKYQVPDGGRFLELGCGAGNVTLEMARRGFDAHGIDIVPEAIDWAKANAEKARLNARFHAGAVVLLEPFEEKSFDIVFDGDCLWMILGEDRPKCFQNVFRVLKPGGIFFAQAHLVTDAIKTRHALASNALIDPTTLVSTVMGTPMYQFSLEDDFLAELRVAGFEIRHHRIGDLDNRKLDVPFYRGTMFVEAERPKNAHRSPRRQKSG